MNSEKREAKFYLTVKKLILESKTNILIDLIKINFIQYLLLLVLFFAGLAIMVTGISMLSMGLLIAGIALFSVSLGGLAVLFTLHKLSCDSFVWLNNIIDKNLLKEKTNNSLK